MSIHLVEGIVSGIQRGPTGISFRIGETEFAAPPVPEAYVLESGRFVHVLVEDSQSGSAQVQNVLVLRWGAREPVYFGPRLGWPYLLLGALLFAAALGSDNPLLLVVPVLLALVHCAFQAQRARVYSLFAEELCTRLAVLSVAREPPELLGEPERHSGGAAIGGRPSQAASGISREE